MVTWTVRFLEAAMHGSIDEVTRRYDRCHGRLLDCTREKLQAMEKPSGILEVLSLLAPGLDAAEVLCWAVQHGQWASHRPILKWPTVWGMHAERWQALVRARQELADKLVVSPKEGLKMLLDFSAGPKAPKRAACEIEDVTAKLRRLVVSDVEGCPVQCAGRTAVVDARGTGASLMEAVGKKWSVDPRKLRYLVPMPSGSSRPLKPDDQLAPLLQQAEQPLQIVKKQRGGKPTRQWLKKRVQAASVYLSRAECVADSFFPDALSESLSLEMTGAFVGWNRARATLLQYSDSHCSSSLGQPFLMYLAALPYAFFFSAAFPYTASLSTPQAFIP